ncbi:hypothetical protein BLS_002625, partial [Venturia inaequalis]
VLRLLAESAFPHLCALDGEAWLVWISSDPNHRNPAEGSNELSGELFHFYGIFFAEIPLSVNFANAY